MEPGFADSYLTLGGMLLEFGQKAEAIKVLERGLEANPDNAKLKQVLQSVRLKGSYTPQT